MKVFKKEFNKSVYTCLNQSHPICDKRNLKKAVKITIDTIMRTEKFLLLLRFFSFT